MPAVGHEHRLRVSHQLERGGALQTWRRVVMSEELWLWRPTSTPSKWLRMDRVVL